MENSKGWICLDIDGTITHGPHSIPDAVIEYLLSLYNAGWQFAFITGRAFTFAMSALQKIPFPYVFAVQNGADILKMPQKTPLKQSYLSAKLIQHLDKIYDQMQEDYLIYSGWEGGDFCYFRPHKFSEKLSEHLGVLMKLVEEPWRPLTSFDELKDLSFPLIKCLGSKEHMQSLAKKLSELSQINVSCIKDPLSQGDIYLNLITDIEASKGAVIDFLRSSCSYPLTFIAAGDDRNDISLLERADIAIAMKGAPDELISLADIIAEPAKDHGIINALQTAINR